MKSGSHFSFFFLRCESGTDAEPSLQKLLREREVKIDDFRYLMGMRVSLAFCLALFHIITLFFTLFPLFSFFLALFHIFFIFSHYFPFSHLFSLSFFAFFFALSPTWPRPQPCRLTLPSLTSPHITSPLLSFLNTIFLKGTWRFSADFCVEKKLAHQKG